MTMIGSPHGLKGSLVVSQAFSEANYQKDPSKKIFLGKSLKVEVLDNFNVLHKKNCLEKIFENPLTHLYECIEPHFRCPRPFLGALCQICNQIVATAKVNPHQWFQGPFL